jgi:predicted DCC family thiol-disulfide oxidoreductase YuxK
MNEANKAVILFDGVCNLCNASVQLVIKNDPGAYFNFASLQSDAGVALMKKYNLPVLTNPESLVLIEEGKVYQYSTAALRIAHKMKSWHKLLYVFIIIPAFLRNAVYKFIARNRYTWWGRQDSCWLPTPDLKKRFL